MKNTDYTPDPLMLAIMKEAKRQGKRWLDLAVTAEIAYSTLCVNAVGKTSPRLRTIRLLLDVIDCDIVLVPKKSQQD